MTEEIVLTRSDLMPLRPGAELEAKTASGRLINEVVNVLSPASLTAGDYKERSRKSDQMAVVLADSVAMLPGLKLPAAGIIRAAALMDLSSTSSSAFSIDFAKNFAEGAALQKVSSLLLPGGAVAEKLNTRLGKGRLAEMANFSLAGSGMAASSAMFRSETWMDGNAEFSLLHGLKQSAGAAGLGAAFGLPAAMLGSGLSKFGLRLANEGKISLSSSLAISGLGSGYLSGFVISGTHEYLAGGDMRRILSSASDGGLMGSVAGAVGLSALSRSKFIERPAAKDGSLKLASHEAATRELQEGDFYRNKFDADLPPRRIDPKVWDSLEIKAAKLQIPESELAARVERLGSAGTGRMRYYVSADNASEIAAQSRSFDEFLNKGGMKLVEDQVRVYSAGGGITITVPETYIRQLDDVLALRLKAAQPANLIQHGSEHVKQVQLAREALDKHPLKDRAHPADILPLIDELPDRSLVKDLMLRADRSASDAWHTKDTGKSFQAAATAGQEDSRITFYAQNRSPLLREYMYHEWAHLLKWKYGEESSRFDLAAGLEKDGYYVSEYSRKNRDENWAEHAASLLHRDPDRFLDTAHGAPLRTVEIGTALVKSLASSPVWAKGSLNAELAARIAYLQDNVIPQAQGKLLSVISGSRKDLAVSSISLLHRIAGEKEVQLLHEMARTQKDPDLREAAFLAGWGRVLHQDTAGGAISLGSGPSRGMREYLVMQAQPGSKSRSMALSFLSKFPDETSRYYFELLTYERNPADRHARALDLMNRAPDKNALKASFAHALKSSDTNEAKVNLALRIIDKHPRLVNEAVDILAASKGDKVRSALLDLSSYYDSRIAQKAKAALGKLDADADSNLLVQNLSSGTQEQRAEAALTLAASGSPKAASALADAYVAARSEAERSAIARAAREHIASALWKFELRRKRFENPEQASLLQKVMH